MSDRDRDEAGRARNARQRDDLGRPLERRTASPSDEAALPPTQAIDAAQARLDSGQPFAAHEVFEAVWKATDGPARELWRGLAQVAVGITHAQRGNQVGGRSLLIRGADTLAPFALDPPHGLDIADVMRWAKAAADDLALTADPPRLRRSGSE